VCGALAKNYQEKIDYVVVNDAGEKGLKIEIFGGLFRVVRIAIG
jgi:hypothetical protein